MNSNHWVLENRYCIHPILGYQLQKHIQLSEDKQKHINYYLGRGCGWGNHRNDTSILQFVENADATTNFVTHFSNCFLLLNGKLGKLYKGKLGKLFFTASLTTIYWHWRQFLFFFFKKTMWKIKTQKENKKNKWLFWKPIWEIKK
jgi:hypothetical protein